MTMATFAGPRRFVPMPVLIIQLLKDISRLILESVRKDVGCTFGILKKRWQTLNNYRDIRTCEEVFNACCCLHNFMLDQMERNRVRVGRGVPIERDGVWLDGNTVATEATEVMQPMRFAKRRSLLEKHLYVLRKQGPILDILMFKIK